MSKAVNWPPQHDAAILNRTHETALQPYLTSPWLIADLQRPRRILSFAPFRPGFRTARHIVIRQVRDADLNADVDANAWIDDQMAQHGHSQSVGMMTSRGVEHFQLTRVGPVSCLATVGLGNAERIGHRRNVTTKGYGTINLVVLIDLGLSEAAMIEAMTIVAQARTLAVLTADIRLPFGQATGTGTDCIAVACDTGDIAFTGLHTEIGEAIGRAVFDAVLAGARNWTKKHGNVPPDSI